MFEMLVRYQVELSRSQIDKCKASMDAYGAFVQMREGHPFLQANVASYRGMWLGEQSTAGPQLHQSPWPCTLVPQTNYTTLHGSLDVLVWSSGGYLGLGKSH